MEQRNKELLLIPISYVERILSQKIEKIHVFLCWDSILEVFTLTHSQHPLLPTMTTKLHIPEPCSEKWSEMTPTQKGCRHCSACDKQIMDFTLKTDAEILEHLRQRDGKVCGKFRPDQLQRSLMAPRAVKRGGLSAIAASFAAVLSAQHPVEFKQIEPTIIELPAEDHRTVLGKVKVFDFLEDDSMRTISGKILDENGYELIFASVRFAQTAYQTLTDLDGQFSLQVPLEYLNSNILEISIQAPGYATKVVPLPQKILLEDLALIPAQTQLTQKGMPTTEVMGMVYRELTPLEYRPESPRSKIRNFFRKLF